MIASGDAVKFQFPAQRVPQTDVGIISLQGIVPVDVGAGLTGARFRRSHRKIAPDRTRCPRITRSGVERGGPIGWRKNPDRSEAVTSRLSDVVGDQSPHRGAGHHGICGVAERAIIHIERRGHIVQNKLQVRRGAARVGVGAPAIIGDRIAIRQIFVEAVGAIAVAIRNRDENRLPHPALAGFISGNPIDIPCAEWSTREKNILPIVKIDDGVTLRRILRVAARQVDGDRPAGNVRNRRTDTSRLKPGSAHGRRRAVIEDLLILDKENVQRRPEIIRRAEALVGSGNRRSRAACSGRGRSRSIEINPGCIMKNKFQFRPARHKSLHPEKFFAICSSGAGKCHRGISPGPAMREIAIEHKSLIPGTVQQDSFPAPWGIRMRRNLHGQVSGQIGLQGGIAPRRNSKRS